MEIARDYSGVWVGFCRAGDRCLVCESDSMEAVLTYCSEWSDKAKPTKIVDSAHQDQAAVAS